ncbi:SpvB/TcaC N-terminal domain-containing protein [Pseudomonas japonica]|uniref:Insecticide toxin TcdB middle/N-terminal region n=1 Tax=Pseudomonas japonica TaxID=256466 RepID=A0A239LVQ2_9PSED|nr:SpvB/TcaC N-terminal domain-containing protein [Pseudomonas japonica]SNT34747.1 Insecticide toxin TcdB middle/N-terminal region [Pseudomonas japonica]
MQDQKSAIEVPTLPKGGGAIQSIGSGWGEIGTSGAASFGIPLPVSPGRGYAPPLTLNYRSTVSNGLFGMGWSLSHGCVARRTSKGVPRYNDDDVMLGPDGVVWLPERDASGALAFSEVDTYRGLALDRRYQVIRHFPRIEGAFERIERWRADAEDPGFWLIHGSDGSLHCYGRNPSSRSTDPDDPRRVGEWLLEESMNAHGEHILYQYKGEDLAGLDPQHPRDFRAQCYLNRVRYGNVEAHPWLYLWQPESIDQVQWHFDLLLDYGERSTALEELPTYEESAVWPVRSDPHSTFAYGFELGNLRLCRQILMFHRFAELGEAPRLVRRLLLEYATSELSYNLLVSAHSQAWASDGRLSSLPPMSFAYAPYSAEAPAQFSEFPAMPGLNDGQHYQFVDLYGEGFSGILTRSDKGWYYREPLRDDSEAEEGTRNDRVRYGDWALLPRIPLADSRSPLRQSLQDLTGDGRLEWSISAPGLNGFFTLDADRNWSAFVPYTAVTPEALHPLAQLADLSGAGLLDLALIGPRSVRLYANRREQGHAAPIEVPHLVDDRLPVIGDERAELVAFSDILGSGQQHLVRIRHNEVRCWPNLGHGRFGRGFRFASLPFEHTRFDASRVRLADLDGSGASDLLYLESDGIRVFMNRSGFDLESPVVRPWPPGVRYDRLCQVSAADLQGLGCASLILSVPHMRPHHWRLDFTARKPYLLERTDNHMGAVGSVEYRSSGQEWLDEKEELRQAGQPAVSHLPMTLHLVTRQTQLDEITGNLLVQCMHYRRGHYDRHERELRGFGLVLQTDSESARGDEDSHFTAPILSKTWFHTGQYPAPARDDFYQDADAATLGADLLSLFDPAEGGDRIVAEPDEAHRRAMAHALSGSPIRSERYGLDDSPQAAVPYSVEQHRYLLRELAPTSPHQPYARMLPLPLESMSLDYERQADDPRCQHSISLAHDEYAQTTHSVLIHCARRRDVSDPPPFDSEHEQTWWRDAHDPAQYDHYLNETRAQAIHLTQPQGWRLGLPWRQRGNALVLPRAALPPRRISYEHLSGPETPLAEDAERVLTGQTVQRYQVADSASREELPDGQASFEALPGYLESAELNEQAMQAYDRVMSRAELHEKLAQLNYERMPAFLPEQADLELWAIRQGFTNYAPASAFHRTLAFRETRSHGLTEVGHDPYYCQVTSVTLPDGCRTLAEIDYHCLQPWRITDPNENVQEALYDGFGRVLATSFHGTEDGEPAGFAALDEYQRESEDLASALAAPHAALQNAASACYYDAFSWMQAPESRQPVHSAVLLADRYPGDPDLQIRISLSSSDGFGRALQSKQKVEPGMAYAVDENGELLLEDGQPVQVQANERWRVSERVEFNNKGLPVRVYRPYFAERWRYINDVSFRLFGYNDQQFYDPLGREVRVLTAKGYLRRQRYLAWYTISEDENDTWEEMQDERP